MLKKTVHMYYYFQNYSERINEVCYFSSMIVKNRDIIDKSQRLFINMRP